MCSMKKLFLEISENSQRSICVRVSFLNKVAVFRSIYSIMKQYCSCHIILIRIYTILSKNIYLEQFSKFAFRKVSCPVGGPSRHILEVLLARRHTLVAQTRRASVRLHHYTNLFCSFGVLHLKKIRQKDNSNNIQCH